MYIFSFTCGHPHIVYWGEAATFSRSPPSTGGGGAEVDINCRARRPGNNGHCYVGLIGLIGRCPGQTVRKRGNSGNPTSFDVAFNSNAIRDSSSSFSPRPGPGHYCPFIDFFLIGHKRALLFYLHSQLHTHTRHTRVPLRNLLSRIVSFCTDL